MAMRVERAEVLFTEAVNPGDSPHRAAPVSHALVGAGGAPMWLHEMPRPASAGEAKALHDAISRIAARDQERDWIVFANAEKIFVLEGPELDEIGRIGLPREGKVRIAAAEGQIVFSRDNWQQGDWKDFYHLVGWIGSIVMVASTGVALADYTGAVSNAAGLTGAGGLVAAGVADSKLNEIEGKFAKPAQGQQQRPSAPSPGDRFGPSPELEALAEAALSRGSRGFATNGLDPPASQGGVSVGPGAPSRKSVSDKR